MEERIPPEHVSKGRMGNDHSGEECSTGRFAVELVKDTVDQSGYIREEVSVVAKERVKRLRHGEHKLSMWQIEEDLVRQTLGEEDRVFWTAGRAQL